MVNEFDGINKWATRWGLNNSQLMKVAMVPVSGKHDLNILSFLSCQSNRVQRINAWRTTKTHPETDNGNMTCCVKITAKHQAILFLHNYRPWSSEWCLARAEKDLRRPINALFWSQRFHFYDWIKYIPNQYNWWASVPMDEIVLMNMEKVGIPWIQTCLKDRWFSYMFFKGLGEVVVFFAEVVSNSNKVTRFASPQFHQLKGKTLPFLGVDLDWSKVVNFKDQILYDFVTRRAFNLEKRDMMEGMLKDWTRAEFF